MYSGVLYWYKFSWFINYSMVKIIIFGHPTYNTHLKGHLTMYDYYVYYYIYVWEELQAKEKNWIDPVFFPLHVYTYCFVGMGENCHMTRKTWRPKVERSCSGRISVSLFPFSTAVQINFHTNIARWYLARSSSCLKNYGM